MRILNLLILLITISTYSQDGFNQTEQYYNEIEKSVIGIDTDQAVQFAWIRARVMINTNKNTPFFLIVESGPIPGAAL